ncbi:MAG: NAD(P)/FAD-dependent oxidoreductase [Aggregatilineales bacterium]
MTKSLNIAIIGAGVAGLSAAWELTTAGHNVTIYEAGQEVGGLAAGFRDEGWDWALEKFYHHWFTTDSEVKKLAQEIGTWDKVSFPRPKTSYWIDGKLVRSEMSPSALFLPLSLLSTIRMAGTGAFLKLLPNGQFLEKYTAHEWLSRMMGEEAYGKFFRPLLIGKFGDKYQSVNMAWMWARIKTRSLNLGTYDGGFQTFLEDLADAVKKKGAKLHLNTPVERIATPDGHPVLTINSETQSFDRVISTISPKLMLKLTDGLSDTDYGAKVGGLESMGAVVCIYALKQSLLTDGTYWLNLPANSPDKSKSRFPFLALVEHTNWLPKSHYNDDVLIYAGDYVSPEHEYFQLSEDELAQRFMSVFETINPDFKPEWVRKTWVFRAPYAQPLSGVNHSQNIPSLKTPLAGVYWASMSQVYPYDRGTNFAIEIGRRVAKIATAGGSGT